MKRISSIERGETIPHDILSCILKTTRKLAYIGININSVSILYTVEADHTTDIEQLVDDFMTFFIAGK